MCGITWTQFKAFSCLVPLSHVGRERVTSAVSESVNECLVVRYIADEHNVGQEV